MKFVKLIDFETEQSVYVAPENVRGIEPRSEIKMPGVRVRLLGGAVLLVRGTPDEVYAALIAAEAAGS